jgi:hypothetical protein
LLKRISGAARAADGVELVMVREGGRHTVYRCGEVQFTVPRHTEINELTAAGILRELEPVFGTGWWQR